MHIMYDSERHPKLTNGQDTLCIGRYTTAWNFASGRQLMLMRCSNGGERIAGLDELDPRIRFREDIQ